MYNDIVNSGWKCAKCDLTNNLWLNLTDGVILCGRRYFDGIIIDLCIKQTSMEPLVKDTPE